MTRIVDDRRRAPAEDRRSPAVTVMVTTYDGAERIGTCLDSLARQTLPPEQFEILVVQNGPACGTPAVVREFAAAHPAVQVRLVELSEAGLGHARNVGLGAARGRYVTYVDDDDWVTPQYLEVLLRHAADDVVPVALVSSTHAAQAGLDSDLDFDNYASRNLLRHTGRTVPCDELAAALFYNAGKLLPTRVARLARYDQSLRSGEDFVYWLEVLVQHPFRLHVVEVSDQAVYCRALREGSLGRQGADYDFLVTQRLDCLAALEQIPADHNPVASHVAQLMRMGQAEWVNRYLQERPGEQRLVVADIRRRGLARVPWRFVNRGIGRDLTLCFRSAPHLDSSLVVAARRLEADGAVTDVVSDDHDAFRLIDRNAEQVAAPWVDRREVLDAPPAEDAWTSVRHLASATADVVSAWEAEKGHYRSVRSRSAALASHLTAALLKARRPGLVWVAEITDPRTFGVEDRAASPVPDDELSRQLRRALHEQGIELRGRGLAELAQLVTFALADRLIIDDPEQLEAMLASCADPTLADRARLVAEVEAIPAPPETPKDGPGADEHDEVVRLAYYGFLDGTHPLSGIGDALQQLHWSERRRLHLQLFTGDPGQVGNHFTRAGLSDVVSVRPFVPLDEFEAVVRHLDVLVVGAAEAGLTALRGPAAVWTVTEEGELTTSEATHSSRPGDVRGAVSVLRALLANHQAGYSDPGRRLSRPDTAVGYRQAVSGHLTRQTWSRK